MLFFGGKKHKEADAADPAPSVPKAEDASDLANVTQSLYKQNLELSVKNKTLSLLRSLYQISLSAFEPDQLCAKIVKEVRTALEFEMVGIFLYEREGNRLMPLAFDSSDRLREVEKACGVKHLKGPIAVEPDDTFFNPIISKRTLLNRAGVVQVWERTDAETERRFESDSRIKTTMGYPLVTEHDVIGVLIISFNREYDSLLSYEKESLSSLVDVTAIALDKSRLYQELEITNKKLGDANVRLKELDQAKSEFISLATHQIRSPLTAIKGYASVVLEGDYGEISPQLREVMKIIFDSCQNLVTIVGEFLDISRIELGRMKYSKSRFSLKELVEETIQQLRPNIEHAGLSIGFQAEDGKSYAVDADKIKIQQVISNLIDNSIKYTPAGGLKITLGRAGSALSFVLADTGVGIDPVELPQLFEKFVRAKDANQVNVYGTGLGLYIAKQMVEAHGGRLWVESEGKGKGSTFHIELKAAEE